MMYPDSAEPLSFNSDDDASPQPPPTAAYQEPAEVNRKPLIPDFHVILLISIGVLLVLLGLIDMIVFYVVPNGFRKKKQKKICEF